VRSWLFALVLLPSVAEAGALIPPMLGVQPNKPCYVVATDGTRSEGKVYAAAGPGGEIMKLKVVGDDGVKHKFKAAGVKELGNQPGDFAKSMAGMATSDSVAAHNVYDSRDMPEWAIWYPIAMPKNGKIVLLQRINPGFDHRIQVYPDPYAQETSGVAVGGVQATGGVEKSYIIVKDGATPVLAKKSDYDKQYAELFGDCATMPAVEKLDWKDFGDHVQAYDQACPTK
jgi:hypothetical protein